MGAVPIGCGPDSLEIIFRVSLYQARAPAPLSGNEVGAPGGLAGAAGKAAVPSNAGPWRGESRATASSRPFFGIDAAME
jgi:hypothetical protein